MYVSVMRSIHAEPLRLPLLQLLRFYAVRCYGIMKLSSSGETCLDTAIAQRSKCVLAASSADL